jgi:hypothetical protein
MAAETMGTLREMLRVRRVRVSADLGRTSLGQDQEHVVEGERLAQFVVVRWGLLAIWTGRVKRPIRSVNGRLPPPWAEAGAARRAAAAGRLAPSGAARTHMRTPRGTHRGRR